MQDKSFMPEMEDNDGPRWTITRVEDGKSRREFAGSEQRARETFDTLIKAGSNASFTLRDADGNLKDKFVPEPPDVNPGVKLGQMTGRPIREMNVPLPAELIEIANKPEFDRMRNRRPWADDVKRDAPPPPQPPPTTVKPLGLRRRAALVVVRALANLVRRLM